MCLYPFFSTLDRSQSLCDLFRTLDSSHEWLSQQSVAPKGRPGRDQGKANKTSRVQPMSEYLLKFWTLGALLASSGFSPVTVCCSSGPSVKLHWVPRKCPSPRCMLAKLIKQALSSRGFVPSGNCKSICLQSFTEVEAFQEIILGSELEIEHGCICERLSGG